MQIHSHEFHFAEKIKGFKAEMGTKLCLLQKKLEYFIRASLDVDEIFHQLVAELQLKIDQQDVQLKLDYLFKQRKMCYEKVESVLEDIITSY